MCLATYSSHSYVWSNGFIVFTTTTVTTTKTTPKDRFDDNNNTERINSSVHLFTKQLTSAQRALFLFRITTIIKRGARLFERTSEADATQRNTRPRARHFLILQKPAKSAFFVHIKTSSIVAERGPATYSPLLLHSYAYADTSFLYPFLSAFRNTKIILYHF